MNPVTFRFRTANPEDVEVIADFNCRLAEETEGRRLELVTVTNGVRRGLAIGDEVSYFLAEHDSGVIGQLMLTREWSDWRDGWMIWLQSVYVVREWRGAGVFRRLLDYALADVASRLDAVNVRLYVEQHNEAARATYSRLGFKSAGYEVMEMPLSR